MYPRLIPFFSCGTLLALSSPVFPASQTFTQATFTQVVNDVSIVKTTSNQRLRAAPNVAVQAPDLVATGGGSRAELQWPDATLTRVGANTVFSFSADDRRIDLKQGSLLFHSPAGKGGGTIQTAAVTAAITGTTIIISCTRDGGFKFLVLEGHGTARLPNGRKTTLKAGQLVYILASSKKFSPVFNYRILEQTGGANLVEGFSGDLPSIDKINKAISDQEAQIKAGTLGITGYLAGDLATQDTITVVDPNSIQPRISGSNNRFVVAFNTDHVISTPLLDLTYTGPAEEALPIFAALTGYQDQGDGPPPGTLGFAGRNILFTTPTVDLTSLTTPSTSFGFLAAESMTLPPSLTILSNCDPLSDESGIAFIAPTLDVQNVTHANGGIDLEAMQLTLAPGSTLTAGGGYITLSSEQPLTLQNLNLLNPNGGVWIESSSDVTLTGGSIIGSTAGFHDIQLYSGSNLSVLNTVFTGQDAMIKANNDLTINNANFNGITNFVDFGAGNQATISNINFPAALSSISISARTPVIQNVNFAAGTNVNVNSASGNWVGSSVVVPVVPLSANFFNSRYNGALITGSGGSGTIAGTQINIGTY